MSDMNTPEVPETETPAAEPAAAPAPEQPDPNAVDDGTRPEPSDETVTADAADGTEPVEQPAPVMLPATPIVVTQPSSASPTQQPETASVVEPENFGWQVAAERVIELVESHRTIGDGDLAAAIEQLRVALADEKSQDADEA